MDPSEKEYNKTRASPDVDVSVVKGGNGALHDDEDFYDPMQESRATRLGLTLESFKKAPGRTRGQIFTGAENADAAELAKGNSMLQQQMKNRHLQMVSRQKPGVLRCLLKSSFADCRWRFHRYRSLHRFRRRSSKWWTGWYLDCMDDHG